MGIAEKWCPNTKTFVFPWGETTITLEDVMLLLGFSVFATLDGSGEKSKEKLEEERVILQKGQGRMINEAIFPVDVTYGGEDASEQLGKKSRSEVDNNDSDPHQELCSVRADGNCGFMSSDSSLSKCCV
ncbi:unnamed protein product [Eruca vesicaria subsp. sativa]|uniref:Aminotransferase-like plant mobile domain-containing protein n=1 Tax=Eruca vesicaria subsp. sativa TaxID=29727 RepID=A0ABC8IUS6_ERUVS|nr:unnamed protein product [Eruca vesicaria subsp. sativa]